jgi:nucleotide-binding universal stress UspA family protein
MKNDIIVGLDDSPSGHAALEWAARHAKSTGAIVRAVHALDGPTAPESDRAPIIEMFKAVTPNPDWVLEFVSGYAGEVLAGLSQDAQLLVVGTREHVGLGRLLVGSVSHYCLTHAGCPVVAVPAPAPVATASSGAQTDSVEQEESEVEPPHSSLILAGVDGSAESLAAVRYAATAAEMRGADLLLVHAFTSPPPFLSPSDMVAALTASRKEGEKLLAAATAQLVPANIHIQTLAEPGDATSVLAGAARWADMLVLGRDRVSWGERVLFGAVTSQVARRINSPLVVVPRGWRAGHVGKPPPVVVAFDTETSGEAALSAAFREAELRRTRLIVLHAEPIRRSARAVVAAGFDLGVPLAKWKEDHPAVTVSTVMVSGDPDAQLVRWSRSAAVLVIGRPHQLRWGSWMRSVANNVMKQTHCPLMIAPQNPAAVRGRRASAAHAALT